MNISIIIPVYHEEKNIEKVLGKISKSVKTEHEILVIYDTPNDPTFSVVKNYIKKQKKTYIRLIRNSHDNGRGVMNAIKTGFAAAKGSAEVVVMADLSDDVTQIDQMYKLIEKGNDIVCASRFMKGGKKVGGPFLKTLLSKTADISLHYLVGLPTHDSTNAYKMYSKKLLDAISVESTGGFEYSLEITLKAFFTGFKITEIPTTWKDREAGKSNFQLRKWLPQYIKWYLWGINQKFSLKGAYLLILFAAFAVTTLQVGMQINNKIPVASGLDLSWQTDAVERLLHGFIAGRDYMFTYGPFFQFLYALPSLIWHVPSYVSITLAPMLLSLLVSVLLIFVTSSIAETKIDKIILPAFLLFLVGIVPQLSGNMGIRLLLPFVYTVLWISMITRKKFNWKSILLLSILPSVFGLYVYDLFPQAVLIGILFAGYLVLRGEERIKRKVAFFVSLLFGFFGFQLLTSIIVSHGLSYLLGSLTTLSDYFYIMNLSWGAGKSTYALLFIPALLLLFYAMYKSNKFSFRLKVSFALLTIAAITQLRTALIRSDYGHVLSALFPSMIVSFLLVYYLIKYKHSAYSLVFIFLFSLLPFQQSYFSYLSVKNIKAVVSIVKAKEHTSFESLYTFPSDYGIAKDARNYLFTFISHHKGDVMVYPYDTVLLNVEHTTFNTYAFQLYGYSDSSVEVKTRDLLQKSPPKYIILQIDGLSTFALDAIPNFTRNPLIAKWMFTNYSVYKKIDNVLLLQYNPQKNKSNAAISACPAFIISGDFSHKSLVSLIKPDIYYFVGNGVIRLPVKPGTNDYLIIPGGSNINYLAKLFNSPIDFTQKSENVLIKNNSAVVSENVFKKGSSYSDFSVYCSG